MRARRAAIVGFGALGQACARGVLGEEGLELAGIVRRPETVAAPRPPPFDACPAVTHVRELGWVDGALLCVPTRVAHAAARELLDHGTPVVECAELHGEEFLRHRRELDRVAITRRSKAIVGAGWDPGVLSLLRGLFGVLTPHGHTETSRRPGLTLHHTTAARAVPGVRDALTTEIRDAAGAMQRYVYVEIEPGADLGAVRGALESDPLFAGEPTLVFAVPSIAALEDEGHGVLMQRRGRAAGVEHQLLLFEGRFSRLALAAQVMLAAFAALPGARHGAFSLFDLPPGALFGALREAREMEFE